MKVSSRISKIALAKRAYQKMSKTMPKNKGVKTNIGEVIPLQEGVDGVLSGLAVEAGDGVMTLTWNDESNNEESILIERSIDGEDFVGINTVPSNATTYIDDTSDIEETAIYYRVTAIKGHKYKPSVTAQWAGWDTSQLDAYLIALAVSANTTPETINLMQHSYRSSASNDAMITLCNTKNKIISVKEHISYNLIQNPQFVGTSFWEVVGESRADEGYGHVISTGAGSYISTKADVWTVQAGRYYKLSFTVLEPATGIVLFGNTTELFRVTSATPVGRKTIYFKAVDNTLILKRGTACNFKFDDIELAGLNFGANYLAIGDSITTPPSWCSDLATNQNWIHKNYAAGGATIAAHFLGFVNATANEPNVGKITIAIGTNDNNAGDMGALRAILETGINSLKTMHPNADIYFVNILPRWTTVAGSVVFDTSNLRAMISLACSNTGITCIDTFTDPWIVPSDTSDGLHPTRDCDAKIMNFMLDYFQQG